MNWQRCAVCSLIFRVIRQFSDAFPTSPYEFPIEDTQWARFLNRIYETRLGMLRLLNVNQKLQKEKNVQSMKLYQMYYIYNWPFHVEWKTLSLHWFSHHASSNMPMWTLPRARAHARTHACQWRKITSKCASLLFVTCFFFTRFFFLFFIPIPLFAHQFQFHFSRAYISLCCVRAVSCCHSEHEH